MKYRFEHCGNPEYVQLHVDVSLTEQRWGLSDTSETMTGADKVLWDNMQGIDGVTETRIDRYSIIIRRAACFSKDDVLKNVLERLIMHLAVSGVEVGELERIPTFREDIAITRCQACVDEERREMELSLREDETVDY